MKFSEVKKEWAKEKRWNKKHAFLYQLKEIYYTIRYRIPRIISVIPLNIKTFIQRGKRGWADSDTWSFDWYLTNIIIEGLKHLKKHKSGHPIEFQTSKEWTKVLDKIIKAFKIHKKVMVYGMFHGNTKEDRDKYREIKKIKVISEKDYKINNEGWKLFKKYFYNLWD